LNCHGVAVTMSYMNKYRPKNAKRQNTVQYLMKLYFTVTNQNMAKNWPNFTKSPNMFFHGQHS